MSLVLIVGGPHDGQRHDVKEECQYLSLPMFRPLDMFARPSPATKPEPTSDYIAEYREEWIRTAKSKFRFFRHIDISLEEAIERLTYGKPVDVRPGQAVFTLEA